MADRSRCDCLQSFHLQVLSRRSYYSTICVCSSLDVLIYDVEGEEIFVSLHDGVLDCLLFALYFYFLRMHMMCTLCCPPLLLLYRACRTLVVDMLATMTLCVWLLSSMVLYIDARSFYLVRKRCPWRYRIFSITIRCPTVISLIKASLIVPSHRTSLKPSYKRYTIVVLLCS